MQISQLFQNKKRAIVVGLIGLVLISVLGYFATSLDLFKGDVTALPPDGAPSTEQIDPNAVGVGFGGTPMTDITIDPDATGTIFVNQSPADNGILGEIRLRGNVTATITNANYENSNAQMGVYGIQVLAPVGYKVDRVLNQDGTSLSIVDIEKSANGAEMELTKKGRIGFVVSYVVDTAVSGPLTGPGSPTGSGSTTTPPTPAPVGTQPPTQAVPPTSAPNPTVVGARVGTVFVDQLLVKSKKITLKGPQSIDITNVSPDLEYVDNNAAIGKYTLEGITPPDGYVIQSVKGTNGSILSAPYEQELMEGQTIKYTIAYLQQAGTTAGGVVAPSGSSSSTSGMVTVSQEPVAGTVSIVGPTSLTFNAVGISKDAATSGSYSLNIVTVPQGYELDYVSSDGTLAGKLFNPYDQFLNPGGNMNYYIFWKPLGPNTSAVSGGTVGGGVSGISAPTGGSSSGGSGTGQMTLSQEPVAGEIRAVGPSTLTFNTVGSTTTPANSGSYYLDIVSVPQGYELDHISKDGTAANDLSAPYDQFMNDGDNTMYYVFWKKIPAPFTVTKEAKETTIANNNKRIDYTIKVKKISDAYGDLDIVVSDSITAKGKLEVAGGVLNYVNGTYNCAGVNCRAGGIPDGIAVTPVTVELGVIGDEAVITYQMLSDNSSQATPADFLNTVTATYSDPTVPTITLKDTYSAFIDVVGGNGGQSSGNIIIAGGGGGSGGSGGGGGSTGGGGGVVAPSASNDKVEVTFDKFISLDGVKYTSANQVKLSDNQKGTLYFKVTAKNQSIAKINDVRFKQSFSSGASNIVAGNLKELKGARSQNDGTIVIDEMLGGQSTDFFYAIDIQAGVPVQDIAQESVELTKYFSSLAGANSKLQLLGIGKKVVTDFSYSSAANLVAVSPTQPTTGGGSGGGTGGINNNPTSGIGGGSTGSGNLKPSASETTPSTGGSSSPNLASVSSPNNGGNIAPNNNDNSKIVAKNDTFSLVDNQVGGNGAPKSSDDLIGTGPLAIINLLLTLLIYAGYRLLNRRVLN